MKKVILLILLCSPLAAQTTLTLASGGIALSCNAVTASTSINPGLAGGCTSFALLTSGFSLPSNYTWQIITTGSPASVTVNFMGSLDNVIWTQLDTASSAATRTVSALAYRFLGCVPATLTGGSSPTVTCQVSVSGSPATGSVSTAAAAGNAYYSAAGSIITADTNIVDDGLGDLAFGAATPTLSTTAANASLIVAPNGTGGLVIPNGAAATPGLALASSRTTGLFQLASNVLGISANGAGDIAFTSGAKIGSGGIFAISAAVAPTGNCDTGWSRDAAGVFDADGNNPCTSGNTAGKIQASAYISKGTKFTLSSNACTATTLLGGGSAGSVASGTTGVCAFTVLMGDSATAPNGWVCRTNDLTTPADTVTQVLPVSTTSASFSGTTASADVIQFSCTGY